MTRKSNAAAAKAAASPAAPAAPVAAEQAKPEEKATEPVQVVPQASPPAPTAPASDAKASQPASEFDSLAGRVLLIRSVSPRGFRRAGMGFGPVETPVEADDLSPAQLDALLGEPALIVTVD